MPIVVDKLHGAWRWAGANGMVAFTRCASRPVLIALLAESEVEQKKKGSDQAKRVGSF